MVADINFIMAEAYKHNCFCLDNENIHNNIKLNWICKKGHFWQRSWEKTYYRKRWCSQCRTEQPLIEKLKKITDEKEGLVFLTNHPTTKSKQIFMCKNNHIWRTSIDAVLNAKKWCIICHRKDISLDIDVAIELASEKNGHCLSTECKNTRSKLQWECYNGHNWWATLASVKYGGTWCKKCHINLGEEITRRIMNILFNQEFKKFKSDWLKNLELDGYCEELQLAFEYDGAQHFKFVKHFHRTKDGFKNQLGLDKLKNELCEKNNVTLIRIPYSIEFKNIKNFIIEKCNEFEIYVPNDVEIDYKKFKDIYANKDDKYQLMKKMVTDKKGTLLTNTYINADTKFEVECEKKHIWPINYHSLQQGRWCPYCSGTKKHTIEQMQELAIEKGGKCLSDTYVNSKTNLKWECEKKHTWNAQPDGILRGKWCPHCNSKKKGTIEQMRKVAAKKGGTCLSKKYINSRTKLKWKCKNKHIWEASPSRILQGHWCRKCNNRGSKTSKKK